MSEKKLNQAQKEAIEYTNGPLLIVAGAGTGKTTVITEKIAYLIENNLAKPEQIVALTFTEKAAFEMEERVDERLKLPYNNIQISTFHTFCQRLLEQYGLEIGLPNSFKLITETDAWLLIREHIYDFNLSYFRPLGNPMRHVHEFLKHFSKCKDELISPQQYLEYAESENLDNDADREEKNRLTELSNAYHKYNQLLLDKGFLDFGDLIFYAVKLLQERPNILKRVQEQYKYILVDEFQDVNWAQYVLTKLISGEKQLAVVGDDDQCLPGNAKILTPSGKKRIDNLKKGDSVITAVGKGYVSLSSINFVKKTKKKARFLFIKTKSGKKLTVTDNHILFCHTPEKSEHKYWYVYLMERQDWGWRMGITNDLTVRLRLERGADRIVAIKGCDSLEQARYFETIYSLKYNIPTVCFKERAGIQSTLWIKSIFQAIDTNKNVQKLAEDLHIDLNKHHYCLGGVNRGAERRIKINISMCYRNYRTRYAKDSVLQSPKVSHILQVETSDKKAIDILKQQDIKVTLAKKGIRVRLASTNISFLENIARQLCVATGGIIDYKFKIGRLRNRTVETVLMPAKNLQVGLFIPIVDKKQGIIMDEIVKINSFEKQSIVYDLEIDRTHNFIADDVVVHNSIYAFRGASVSNILRFKDDFKNAKSIVLNENYRSGQKILDTAYTSIQNNNPDRLEVKLSIDKKLKSQVAYPTCAAVHLHSQTLEGEVKSVVQEIIRLKNENADTSWDDFAILARANSHVEPFLQGLQQAGIPYEFLSSVGLFRQPLVMDALNYFKILDNYYESSAVYRLLRMPCLSFGETDLQKLTLQAKKKAISYYEALQRGQEFQFSPEGLQTAQKLLSLLEEGMKDARKEKPSTLLYNFLEKSGCLKHLTEEDNKGNQYIIHQTYQLNQFFDVLKTYEETHPDAHIHGFLEQYNYTIESGDEGKLYQPLDTLDSVNILTVHGSKGLEFRYVFIVNLVEERFPTRRRGESLELPFALIKEKLPEGDTHIQEERRLFYVAMTRAKQRLYFCSAKSYGGVREKKISRFLNELGFTDSASVEKIAGKQELQIPTENKIAVQNAQRLPKVFSFSQIKSYQTCPYQYKLAHIIKLPTKSNASFSFGTSIHSTFQKFYERMQEMNAKKQATLFDLSESSTPSDMVKVPTLDELLEIYHKNFIEDWYKDRYQKEKYYKKGKEILTLFYHSQEGNWRVPAALESAFKIKVGNYLLRGRIDRIDQLPDGSLEIIDYKTGESKDKLTSEDKEQLLIYQIAAQTLPQYRNLGKVEKLTFFYVNDNIQMSFVGKDKELENLSEKLISTIQSIHAGEFSATPNQFSCSYCDFRDICEYRSL